MQEEGKHTVGHLGERGLLDSHMQSRKWYGGKPSVGGRMSSRKGESNDRPRMGRIHISGQFRSLSGKKCSRIGCSVGRECGEQRIRVGPTYGCSHLNGDVEQRSRARFLVHANGILSTTASGVAHRHFGLRSTVTIL